ncbi:MAG: helix-turn-helix domain-containing protein [Xenococcus sp. (in: cyanobacteria)]
MQDDPFAKDVPIITQLKTNDADELAEFVRGWDQEHIQLTKGTFEWETCIIEIDGFQFSEEFYGAPALLRGSSPPGTFVIGIPKRCLAKFLYGGNMTSKDCCLTGNFHQYLDLKVSNETGLLLVTAPIALILTRAEKMKLPLTREQLLSPGIMKPDPTAIVHLSDYLEELLLLAKTHPDRLTYISQGNSMSHLILEDSLPLVLDVLTFDSNFLPEKKSPRQKLVQRAEGIMRDRLALPITLTDLCQELKTSKRSLYYAFNESFGLPPMQYLKILRLNGVRRALKLADPQTSKVTTIAGRYGFWHMGQFSTDYRIMFGESPSTTLRKE